MMHSNLSGVYSATYTTNWQINLFLIFVRDTCCTAGRYLSCEIQMEIVIWVEYKLVLTDP